MILIIKIIYVSIEDTVAKLFAFKKNTSIELIVSSSIFPTNI